MRLIVVKDKKQRMILSMLYYVLFIGFFTSNILLVITETLTMVLSIALLFYINQCIAIVVVMTMPIYVVLYNIFKKVLYTVNLEFFEQRSQYFAECLSLCLL